jgi:nucleoid-associated protein EbfC
LPTPKCSDSAKSLAVKYAKFATSRSRHVKLPGNMQQMMRQAQQMQEKMAQDIAQIKVTATAGGGMVSVAMDGQKNLLSVKIDPEVAGDVEMLQDMILAACGEAVKQVETQIQQKTAGLLGGMGLPPGLF